MPKLKRCPFCGEKPHMQGQRIQGVELYRIACYGEKCPCTPATSWHPTSQDAVKAWNTRE